MKSRSLQPTESLVWVYQLRHTGATQSGKIGTNWIVLYVPNGLYIPGQGDRWLRGFARAPLYGRCFVLALNIVVIAPHYSYFPSLFVKPDFMLSR